jgi:molybdate transport system substrate-binding protein
VPAEDVRSALAYVARGETPLGIVYETDALVEKRVRIVDTFPEDSHAPITYPVALVATAKAGAGRFVGYLKSPDGRAVFAKYGFQNLP